MNKKIVILSALVILLAVPVISLAVTVTAPPISISKNLDVVLEDILTVGRTMLWSISFTFVIIMFSLAGYKYLTAQGEPAKIDEANKAVVWGTADTVVLVVAWSIIELVRTQLSV